MLRLKTMALVAACLLTLGGPAWAQATADQLNKLSLEALTATPPRTYAPRRAYAGPSYHRYGGYRHGFTGSRHGRFRYAATVRHGRTVLLRGGHAGGFHRAHAGQIRPSFHTRPAFHARPAFHMRPAFHARPAFHSRPVYRARPALHAAPQMHPARRRR